MSVGTRVYLAASGLRIICTVIAEKNSYGHARVQIAPVAGAGRAWVDRAKVSPAPSDGAPGLREDVWGVRA